MRLPFRLSRPAIVALTVALVAFLGAAAYAALPSRLKGTATTKGAQSAQWVVGSGVVNDSLGDATNDPTSFGMTPTRETANVGSIAATPSASSLTVTLTDIYAGYKGTVQANATFATPGFVVQKVTATGIPAGVTIGLNPAYCSGSTAVGAVPVQLQIGIGVTADQPTTTSAPWSFEVELVPSGAFVAGQCNAWV
jgi:hypothetical protein